MHEGVPRSVSNMGWNLTSLNVLAESFLSKSHLIVCPFKLPDESSWLHCPDSSGDSLSSEGIVCYQKISRFGETDLAEDRFYWLLLPTFLFLLFQGSIFETMFPTFGAVQLH
ncbi:hypothetical protein CDAR_454971 [Caerostris darwini]|uniref:Cytochrome c biogenesis B n=1 Tax=Caerostris darwini TaxID=1538125 RepID=A0AAV4P6T6_9ARAC|nr:hypothetical protein CDAR_454971 [Caerostris darwini]